MTAQHGSDLQNGTDWFDRLETKDAELSATQPTFSRPVDAIVSEHELPIGVDTEADALFKAAAVYYMCMSCTEMRTQVVR